MTRCRPLLIVFFILPFLLPAVPAQAQQADTSARDTSARDTSVAGPPPGDTEEVAPGDTAMADAPTPADTIDDGQKPAAAMDSTVTADSMATAVDSLAADTTLSASERRARDKKRARSAAESWLSLTDAGQFGKSWDRAAASLQDKISREAWMSRGEEARSTLDSLMSRTLTRVQYRDSTDQLSTSDPIVALQYRSTFGGGSVLEALVTTKKDTSWKVAGYRIVPVPPSKQKTDSTSIGADSTDQQ